MSKYKLSLTVMGLVTAVSIAALIVVLLNKPEPVTDSAVLAEVNGEEVTKQQLYDFMYSQSAAGGMTLGEQALDQMIDEMLIEQEAKKADIQITQADIDQAVEDEITSWKEDYGGEETFQLVLAQSGMTEESLRANVKAQMPVQLKLEKLLGPEIEFSDEEIETYFEENKQLYAVDEQLEASHILVEEKELAEDLLQQLNEENADFAELAKEHSIDEATASEGGVLNPFSRGMMDPALEEAAFALEPGELSGVVEGADGYHIIKVTDKIGAKEPNPDEVRDEIEQQLYDEALNTRISGWIVEIRDQADIK